jgi:hypothetical protein
MKAAKLPVNASIEKAAIRYYAVVENIRNDKHKVICNNINRLLLFSDLSKFNISAGIAAMTEH